jgi:RimJ/RimL family protein N-acetyltransferase
MPGTSPGVDSLAGMASRAVIVGGERVVLTAPEREEFVARWPLFNDPLGAMLVGAPSLAHGTHTRTMPPVSREHREALYAEHVARRVLCFDVRLADGEQRCVGEAYLTDLTWPRASCELGLTILSADDRGQGLGAEAATLVCAYAFDGLGLNRISVRFPVDNAAASAAMERAAPATGARQVGVERQAHWVFGRHADVAVWEVLRGEFPPHPATVELRTPPGEFQG